MSTNLRAGSILSFYHFDIAKSSPMASGILQASYSGVRARPKHRGRSTSGIKIWLLIYASKKFWLLADVKCHSYWLGSPGVQSVFNLILDIHVINCQLPKKWNRWPVSHDCIALSCVQLIEVTFFLSSTLTSYWFSTDRWLRSIFSRGIQWTFCLWRKLNCFRKTFLKRSQESFAFSLG